MTYMERVDLLAKMENVLDVPAEERLTRWFGDYSMYEPKSNVSQDDIDRRIGELDKQIDHKKTVYVEVKETLSRVIPVENPMSIKEAVDTVMEMYKNEEIVLDYEDYQGVQIHPGNMDFDMEM